MNIAVFIKSTTFHKGYGGLETQNKVLCEGLVRKGHKITVFSPQRELEIIETFENDVSYRFVSCVYKLGLITGTNNWVKRSYEEFVKLHAKERFDLVISQSSAGIGVIPKKSALQIKVVSISHGSILGELRTKLGSISSFRSAVGVLPDLIFVARVYFGRQRAFIHGSDKVIAVSNAVKKSIVDETFVNENKVEVVYNGVDPAKFHHKVGKYGKPHVVYLGRVIRSKGVLLLVDMVKDLNCVLDVVGEGEDMEILIDKVKSLDLTQKIVLHGRLSPDKVPGRLLASDIFVFPTLRVEGLPMVLVEAIFAGLPIVAFDMGGVSDVVQDGVNGYLLSSGDLIGFKAKLRELVENTDLRNQMGKASLELAEKFFSIDTMVSKYENIFMGVLR